MAVDHETANNPQPSLLTRWGRFVVRRPRSCLIIPLLVCLLLVPVAMRVTHNLSTVGWTPENTESRHVQRMIDDEFGRGATNHYILFSDPTGRMRATDREFRLAVEQAMRPFRNDPNFTAVYTWGSTTNETLNDTLVSEDGTQSLAMLVLAHTPVLGADGAGDIDDIRSRLTSDTLDIKIGGWPATAETFLDVATADLFRAEVISIPITLILLLMIFGGILAAGLPVALAVLSMIVTLAVLAAMSRLMTVNIFSINAVTMLGLAVGIDYALIMVSRFREESAATPLPISVPRVIDTAGRAVLIAGSIVAIGLLGLILFDVPAAISTGIAGACVVLVCIALSLSALPATFVLLGHRIAKRGNWNVSRPALFASASAALRGVRHRHPLAILILCGALLLSLAVPLRGMNGASPTMEILPSDTNARIVYDTIAESFPNASISPITVIVEPRTGSMMAADNLTDFQELTFALSHQPGVQSVESIWTYIPSGMTPTTLSTSLLLEPELVRVSASMLTPNAALINIVADPALNTEERRALVDDLRTAMPALTERQLAVSIGGDAGLDLDLMQHVDRQAPKVLGFVIGLTWLAFFVQFRSVFLPTKAILLNLLSISASFGALVWIFEDGHLSNLLAFEPTGSTVIVVPILMFCFLFGLSMDFEVIMLSRIREVWQETGDNNRAIDLGLERSAGIVTASAAVLLVIFSAFSTSDLQIVKSLGIGLGIAVFIDATIIRLLLLPATMQLMGDWNWWRPFSRRPRTISPPRRHRLPIHPVGPSDLKDQR